MYPFMDSPFDMDMVLRRGKALGLAPYRIAQEAGLGTGTMSRWLNAQACPTWPKWQRLLAALERLEQQRAADRPPVTSFRGSERTRERPAGHPATAGVPSQAQPGRVRAAGHLGRAS